MRNLILIAVVLTAFFASSGAVRAATFVVTKTADTDDGVCDADCSFREAIAQVNLNTSGTRDRVEFSVLFDQPQTIALSSRITIGDLTAVEIVGRGNQYVTLTTAAGNNNGVLNVQSAFARFYNLRFSNAARNPFAPGIHSEKLLGFSGGAAIAGNGSEIEIERCLFENNVATLTGGAINLHSDSIIIKNSTFRNNQAVFGTSSAGGAVFLEADSLTIEGSTFTGNTAAHGAAVLFNDDRSFYSLSIVNSTFTGNTALASGVIGNNIGNGVTALKNITVFNNTTAAEAVNFNGNPARNTITNSIVAQNAGGELSGVTQIAPNLIGGNPLLGALAFNGGETETLALLAGSPAIDAGSATNAPAADQRGAARPFGAAIDLGAFEAGVAVTSQNTPTGAPVNVSLGTLTVNFTGVAQAGTTTQIPIDGATAGTLPGGYTFGAGLPAFQISTTSVYSSPVTVCIQALSVNDPIVFNALSLFHYENGQLINRTISRDFPSRTVCAQTASLSPFAIAQNLAPTAAGVEISGRVFANAVRGLSNATVFLTDSAGNTRAAQTGLSGVYRFDEIPVGQSVIITVQSKKLQFAPQIISVREELTNLNFFPLAK